MEIEKMENKKRISVILLTLAMVVPIFIAIIPITRSEVQLPSPMMIGPEFRSRTGPIDITIPVSSGGIKSASSGSWVIGEEWYWLAYDDFGPWGLELYTLMAIGEHTEVWVQNDLSYWGYEGDTRECVIEQWQIDYLLSEFEGNIWQKDYDSNYQKGPLFIRHKEGLTYLLLNNFFQFL